MPGTSSVILSSLTVSTTSAEGIHDFEETPLGLDNPAHLDALKRAYERFPEIGGRVTRG